MAGPRVVANQDVPGVAKLGDPRSIPWMRTAISGVRAKFRKYRCYFPPITIGRRRLCDHDVSFMDAIEHQLVMVGENDDEFYKLVGYEYQRFSQCRLP